MLSFIFGVLFVLLVFKAHAFSEWFVSPMGCKRQLKDGRTLYQEGMVEVELYGRSGEKLKSGDTFSPGGKYSMVVIHRDDHNKEDNSKGEFAMEATSPIFTSDGNCDNRKTLHRQTEVTIPTNQQGTIEIWAGWSDGHMKLYISAPFKMKFPEVDAEL